MSRGRHSKAALRRRFRELRAAKPPSVLAELGARVAANVLRSRMFLDAEKIALYSPVGGEVDTSELLSEITRRGKRAFFPRVCGNGLRFFEARGDELSAGSFGIAEPPAEPEREAAVSGLDLVVVPGVCFDRFGSRIGYGKGFYDRAIRGLDRGGVCAVAYSFQFVDFEIPAEPRDERVGFVITERGVFRAETKKGGDKDD